MNVAIQVDDSALLPLLEKILPPLAVKTRSGKSDCRYAIQRTPRGFRVRLHDGRIVSAKNHAAAVDLIEGEIQLAVAASCRKFIFVHAGVVALDGCAIVIPGRSFSGKSTLVRALIERGAIYYSDEYAVVDARGWVRPFPRPLSLRTAAGPALRVDAQKLGKKVGVRAVPVGLVVLTRFQVGGRFQPRDVSPGQAVLELFDNTVPARRAPAQALHCLHRAVRNAVCLKSPRGEAARTAKILFERLNDLTKSGNQVRKKRALTKAQKAV